MRRAPIVLSSTVAGLAVTLGFHAHAPSSATPAASTAQPRSQTTSSSATSPATATTSKASTASASTTVTSDVESNQYGNVELQVTVKDGRITAVQALQLPSNDGKSVQINAYAEPQLQASALAKQSADVDAVSGATYTSESYRLALQSALDKAGLSTGSAATS